MHGLLIGYMFLFIHRPFEFWPALGELHVERVYIIGVLFYWLLYPGKRWIPDRQHLAYALFATAVLASWMLSPFADKGQQTVEDWLKIVVFYFLMVTTVNNEKGLKRLAVGFVAVMAVYMLHSLREFMGGRHTFRMGIPRMIGVDTTLGDPNSFGASIVFALPFVTAFWHHFRSRWARFAILGYLALSVGCVLLTGSRSSLLGVLVWGAIVILRSRHRWAGIGAAAVGAPLIFLLLPGSLQTRFETLIDPNVGPESARISGEGRMEGLIKGVELLEAYPLSGAGPGAWRPATRSKLESHNLYGQIAGELGFIGIAAFGFVLICFVRNYRRIRRRLQRQGAPKHDLIRQLNGAIAMGLFLMLFEGNFGHNLFRHNWLWYGAFLMIAQHCLMRRRAVLPAPRPPVVSVPNVQGWRVRFES